MFCTNESYQNFLTSRTSEVSLDEELTPSDIVKMQYCPITSVDVERSFSRYKAVLRSNRRYFEFENFKIYVINYNQDN